MGSPMHDGWILSTAHKLPKLPEDGVTMQGDRIQDIKLDSLQRGNYRRRRGQERRGAIQLETANNSSDHTLLAYTSH